MADFSKKFTEKELELQEQQWLTPLLNSDLAISQQTLLKQIFSQIKQDKSSLIEIEQVLNSYEQEMGDSLSKDNLRKKLSLINKKASELDLAVAFKSRKQIHIEVQLDDQKLQAKQVETRLLQTSQDTADSAPLHPQPPEANTELPIYTVFFSHAWEKTNTPARHSQVYLANELEEKFDYGEEDWENDFQLRLFRDQGREGISSTEPFMPQLENECETAFAAILLYNDKYPNSEVCQNEVEYFLDAEGNNQEHKFCLVILGRSSADRMRSRYKKRVIELPKNHKNWLELYERGDQSEKDEFIEKIFDAIVRSAKDHHSKRQIKEANNQQSNSRRELSDRLHKAQAKLCIEENTQEPNATSHLNSGQRIKIDDHICQWANSQAVTASRMMVLLGDFGAGKSTTCQLALQQLLQQYNKQPQDKVLPVYLDLKKLLNSGIKVENSIEQFIEVMLSQTGLDDISGADVVKHIQSHNCLLIFDGLDEIGHKLSKAETTGVFNKLLGLIPNEVWQHDLKKQEQDGDLQPSSEFPSKTRILITCRTHFFRDHEQQMSFITGQDRHKAGQHNKDFKNYQTFYMAPFSKKQIDNYLVESLGEQQGQRAIELIDRVHDLRGLSERPIMLNFIRELIGDLLQLAAQGRHINAATIYLALFNRVGHRDQEKHEILLDDKQQLLAELALFLREKNRTTIPVARLDAWFKKYAKNNQVLSLNKNQTNSASKQLELYLTDLYNACLLVRDEDNHYRFAHTSFFEFFVACGIFQRICQSPQDNKLDIELNAETQQFLLDWRETTDEWSQEEFDEGYVNLMQSSNSSKPARLLGFNLWSLAAEQNVDNFPELEGANLAELDLSNRTLLGTSNKLLNLKGVNFSNAKLVGMDWHFCDLSGANFDNTDLLQSWLYQSQANNISIDSSTITATKWQGCQLSNTDFSRVKDATNSTWLDNTGDYIPVDTDFVVFNQAQQITINQLSAQTYLPHSSVVSYVAINQDNTLLVSASYDNTIKLWDINTRQLLHSFTGHEHAIRSVAFNHSGTHIVSASHDNTIKLWDVNTRQLLHSFTAHKGAVTSVAFNYSGTHIVSASNDNTIKFWDINTRQLLYSFTGHERAIRSVAFNHSGTHIVSASHDNTIKLWDVNTKQLLHSFTGHEDWVTSVTFNHSGTYIVSASYDNTIKLWDVNTKQLLHSFTSHEDWVTSVAFNHSGTHIVSASHDNTIKLWDVNTKQLLHSFTGHESAIRSVAFNHSGTHIVSAFDDNTIKLWDVNTKQLLHSFTGHERAIRSVAFNHSGTYIVSASNDNTIKLWDVNTKQLLHSFTGHERAITSVAFNHSGTHIVSASHDNTIKLWDVNTKQLLYSFTGHERAIRSVAFNHSGTHIVSASDDNTIKLWDVNTKQLLHSFTGHERAIRSVAFNHSGTHIVSASDDNTIKIWNVNTKQLLHSFTGHEDWVTSVAFNHSGTHIVSASDDNTIKLWDVNTKQLLHSFTGHESAIRSVAFNHSGTYIVSASHDNTIKLWNVNTKKLLHSFTTHEDWVTSVAFNPSDTHIVSSSHDGTIKLWDINTKECLTSTALMPNNEYAVIDEVNKKVVAHSSGAWRWLGATISEWQGVKKLTRLPIELVDDNY